jgi:hypothetical protein
VSWGGVGSLLLGKGKFWLFTTDTASEGTERSIIITGWESVPRFPRWPLLMPQGLTTAWCEWSLGREWRKGRGLSYRLKKVPSLSWAALEWDHSFPVLFGWIKVIFA